MTKKKKKLNDDVLRPKKKYIFKINRLQYYKSESNSGAYISKMS